MVDQVAFRLGISSLELRLCNGVRKGDVNSAGIRLETSTGLIDCLKTIDAHPLWQERQRWKSSAPPFKKRGVGIACVMHGMGYGPVIPDQASARVELTEEGRFRIFSGVVDMGQGNGNTFLQIAGHILNQEIDRLEMVLPDTARTLPSGSSSASRTTFTFGNALISAAQAFKERLLRQGRDYFKADRDGDVDLRPGRLFHLPTGRTLTLDRLVLELPLSERVTVSSYRAPVVEGADTLMKDDNLRLHGFPHLIFSYGAHLACVEVDDLTGRVDVINYLAVSDCGRVINPQVFEQQIHGGISQGLGFALCEELITGEGRIETLNLSTYIVPTSMDTPDIESIAVGEPEEKGPFGLKGAGEISVDGPLPAVANGVADACGIRVRRFPLTGQRVLEAWKRETERGSRD
jgi:CO/xanthine dehydrogenase Mo-binding subunit